MRSIDLNCDMGEGCGNDSELMEHVSSVNVACGYHAGDNETMLRTAEMAMTNGLRIGAHPSYRDRKNFGRTSMDILPKEVFDLVFEQAAAFRDICASLGGAMTHVKPHGALYNEAAKDPEIAAAIAEAVKKIDDQLDLYGLSGSHLISEAEKIGLRTASEAFADRTYQRDGTLTPRTRADALISDTGQSIEQVLTMVGEGLVKAVDGTEVRLRAETICIHGDGEHAVEFAKAIRAALVESGFEIAR